MDSAPRKKLNIESVSSISIGGVSGVDPFAEAAQALEQAQRVLAVSARL
jgi:hypothetical protein